MIIRSILICVVMILLTSCAASRSASEIPPRPAKINHLAFIKLQHPTDADELIADCDRLLATIPGVVSYYAGTHLDTGRGERVDGNYDVGLCLGFNAVEDLNGYVEHPNHVQAVNKWRSRWQWIRVHDVLDETP